MSDVIRLSSLVSDIRSLSKCINNTDREWILEHLEEIKEVLQDQVRESVESDQTLFLQEILLRA